MINDRRFLMRGTTLVRYMGYEKDVTLPEGVRTIGEMAFSQKDIVRIVLPKSLEKIKKKAFNFCTDLTEVVFSEGLQFIGEGAFNSCKKLKRVRLPDTVTTVEDDAFKKCHALEELIIPDHAIANISASVFAECPKLVSKDNFLILQDILFAYKGEEKAVRVPDGVTKLAAQIFAEQKLHTVILPDSVTEIGKEAFHSCHDLTHIRLSPNVRSIGEKAFAGCKALKQICLPDGITELSKLVFSSCHSLTTVMLPRNLTTIGSAAFSYCRELKELDIPETVTEIHDTAFISCGKLVRITIPKHVRMIGDDAFNGCAELEEVILPEGLISIGANAFADCKVLKQINIPDSVAEIGEDAFVGCKGLADHRDMVVIRDVLYYFDGLTCELIIPDGITAVSGQLIHSISLFSRIALPESLTAIGKKAFVKCVALEEVNLPDSLSRIGEDAFHFSKHIHFRCKPEKWDLLAQSVPARANEEKAFGLCFLRHIDAPKRLEHAAALVSARRSEILEAIIADDAAILLPRFLDVIHPSRKTLETYMFRCEGHPELLAILLDYSNRLSHRDVFAAMDAQAEKELSFDLPNDFDF